MGHESGIVHSKFLDKLAGQGFISIGLNPDTPIGLCRGSRAVETAMTISLFRQVPEPAN
jgi:hypothetical protein